MLIKLCRAFIRWLTWVLMTTVLLVALTSLAFIAFNLAQPPKIMIYTDPLTKCQYLLNTKSSMTPRLGFGGRHTGCTATHREI